MTPKSNNRKIKTVVEKTNKLYLFKQSHKLDLVNMNAYIKGAIMSICFQDIERKQNFGFNQGP